jgi:hypothetical protein
MTDAKQDVRLPVDATLAVVTDRAAALKKYRPLTDDEDLLARAAIRDLASAAGVDLAELV